jgi:60 kDa SS-A/Ro ribonucleoprotein
VASDPLTMINLRATPQSQSFDPTQVRNNAGGFVFELDEMARLRRFLTMGTAGGTYYVSEKDLTVDNAGVIADVVRTRGVEVIAEILAISTAGRAPKQNPTIFALAMCASAGDVDTRRAALAVLPQVCRTGTHLFLFVKYVEQLRGWGPTLRRGVASWYLDKPVDKLAYQLVKYRSREDWTHRDLLRLSHPNPGNWMDGDVPARRAAFDFACGRFPTDHNALRQADLWMIEGFLKAQSAPTPEGTARLVDEYGLPWEALQPDHLASPKVWGALVDRFMPQTALMRNLPRLTRLGVLDGERLDVIAQQLATGMSKAKVHPVNVLVALRTYASGRSVRGESTWTPIPAITNGLDAGFYEAFGGVEPAGKRTLVALDVSGSMTSPAGGLPISCREASAAIGMVTMATEPMAQAVGFTAKGHGGYWNADSELTPLDLSNRRRLDDVIRGIADMNFGGTDCALPMVWALEQRIAIETVIILTDNETWAGAIHPHQALQRYRDETGIPTRLIVVGMTSSGFTISDPRDAGSLDVAGFDSAVPNLISDFSAGRV